ncbi:MAG: hypothetical protein FJ303_16410 [Planctomycetes bacterium]|nr:hypothetical protein [Planctomycetota bacterium]
MTKTTWSVGLLAAAVLLVGPNREGVAQTKEVVGGIKSDKKDDKKDKKDKKKPDDKKPYEKHDMSALNDSLRDVINTGAKMFNEHGDHAGCYRLYQGSLLSVKPFLSKDLQGRIDLGIANAERMPFYADRAFELRRVLDDIRASTKGAGGTSTKKGGGFEIVPDKGQVDGKLSFDGKAVPGGYFVTLISSDGKTFSSAIQNDGTFQFQTGLNPGDYRIAIQPVPDKTIKTVAIPARYASEATSGLMIRVEKGRQTVDLNLVK